MTKPPLPPAATYLGDSVGCDCQLTAPGELECAIGELRPEYRTAVLLRHVEGYAYDEIAQIMEIPLGTVKTYLHRARAELKETLSEQAR